MALNCGIVKFAAVRSRVQNSNLIPNWIEEDGSCLEKTFLQLMKQQKELHQTPLHSTSCRRFSIIGGQKRQQRKMANRVNTDPDKYREDRYQILENMTIYLNHCSEKVHQRTVVDQIDRILHGLFHPSSIIPTQLLFLRPRGLDGN